MLAAVATSTRETVAMQLRINATRARTYRTAQLIAGIVAFFVGLLIVTNRDYMEPFGIVRRPGRAARRRRADRRVDLGDDRAVPPGALGAPAARRRATTTAGATMIWAAVLAGALGAGVWVIARASSRRPGRCGRWPTSSSNHASSVAGAAGRRRRCAPAVAPSGRPASAAAQSERLRGRPRRARPHVGVATCSTSSGTPLLFFALGARAGGRCSRCSTSACPC